MLDFLDTLNPEPVEAFPQDWLGTAAAPARPEEWSPSASSVQATEWARVPLRRDPFIGLSRVLDDGRWILDLKANWDEEGAGEYSAATYLRAVRHLESMFDKAWNLFGRALPEPLLGPADDGSIDMFWEVDDRNLLINIAEGKSPHSYYGQDRNGDSLGGSIGSGARVDLVAWLLKLK